MKARAPKIIAINHDEYAAKYVGSTWDGLQFILTTPFEAAHRGRPGAEFLALYLFDAAGKLLNARIENLGPRATMDNGLRAKLREQWLGELGEIIYGRIEVAPFSVNRFGTEFGLVLLEPDDEVDHYSVLTQVTHPTAFLNAQRGF